VSETDAIDAFFADTGIEFVSFDQDQAVTAGRLASITRKAGLSLGDRSCRALAKLRQADVLTADRPWQQVADAAGLTIMLTPVNGSRSPSRSSYAQAAEKV
jgi:ribonuclease VapC